MSWCWMSLVVSLSSYSTLSFPSMSVSSRFLDSLSRDLLFNLTAVILTTLKKDKQHLPLHLHLEAALMSSIVTPSPYSISPD